MDFTYNRNTEDTIKVMESKGLKHNIKIVKSKSTNKSEKDNVTNVQVSLGDGKKSKNEGLLPVIFKGKMKDTESGSEMTGKFTFGFYLYSMVIVAIILIVARFGFSLYNMQEGNLILCGIVTVLLLIVIAVVVVKSKPDRQHITDFLNDLNKK